MRARDLCIRLPAVGTTTPVTEAARLLADHDLPGLIVVDADGRPLTVLSGVRLLSMAVPGYCQDDPTLARVIGEPAADVFAAGLTGRTVADLLPERPQELPVVDPDATPLEIAALMARSRTPLAAVNDDRDTLRGVITLHRLLDSLLPR